MTKTCWVWCSIIFGFLAAVLWFWATIITVPYVQRFVKGAEEAAIIDMNDKTGQQTDFLYTAKEQTRWNRWAALATAISMFCQAMSLTAMSSS